MAFHVLSYQYTQTTCIECLAWELLIEAQT